MQDFTLKYIDDENEVVSFIYVISSAFSVNTGMEDYSWEILITHGCDTTHNLSIGFKLIKLRYIP